MELNDTIRFLILDFGFGIFDLGFGIFDIGYFNYARYKFLIFLSV